MSDCVPISDLLVVGYLGRFSAEDWPVRLLPVYKSRDKGFGVLPPFQHEETGIRGVKISPIELEEMIEEGEVTEKKPYLDAQPDHTLWLGPSGLQYAPCGEANRAFDQLSLEAIKKALDVGLLKGAARALLFRSLRARPTSVANALLSVHFQLTNEISLVKPIRVDLEKMKGIAPSTLEEEMIQAILEKKPRRDALNAIASELRRAERESFAQALLEGTPAVHDWAARPTPPLTWAPKPVRTAA